VAFRSARITRANMADVVGKSRGLDMSLYSDVASVFFG
jgi:hypothetical protein